MRVDWVAVNWTNCVSGVQELSNSAPAHQLFPKPASDVLNIRSAANLPVDVTVFDISGREVLNACQVKTVDVAGL